MMELVKHIDSSEVLAHLPLNVADYYANQTQRDLVVELADYLARKLETQRPDEASAARVLRELVKLPAPGLSGLCTGIWREKELSCVNEASIQQVAHHDSQRSENITRHFRESCASEYPLGRY
jgi:hypothetical protein